MKNIETSNLFNQKNLRKNFTILGVLFLVSSIFLFLFYINTVKNILSDQAKTTLTRVSDQNVSQIKNVLSLKKEHLEKIAKTIEEDNNYEISNIVSTLKIHDRVNGFYNLGIIDSNGICYNTLDEKIDVSDDEYFIDGMKGISSITASYLSKDKSERFNIFTEPIYKEDNVIMVLTGVYKSEDFAKLLNISSFDNKGHSMVIDSNGNLVSKIPNDKYVDTTETDAEKQYISKLITNNLSTENTYFVDFNYKNEDFLAYCEKIGVNDWYLVSYAPKKEIYKNISVINTLIFSVFIILYISIIIITFILLKNYITSREKIKNIVFINDLTNEKNEEYLKLYFKNMTQSERNNKYLVVFDIDKFNSINVMHGLKKGDESLKYIVKTFKNILPKEEIFKYHSDIFVAIIKGSCEQEIIDKLAKLQNKINEDIENNKIVPMNLSFGCCALNEFDDLHSIYNNALISKNEIKANVNKKINFFNEENKIKIIENKEIESMFIDSLKNDEFEVWYQPKYNMLTNKIYGAEALVRWIKKDGQFISPGKFIPVFESNGQILKLDELVTEIVFKNVTEMQDLGLDIKPISINLSRLHIEHFEIICKIKDTLDKYKINPSYVSFEITESAVIGNNDLVNEIINKLHNLGFKVDIDDYGTGNSTLSSICSSDFDTLKLDKSYIDNIGNPKVNKIISSTIHMANDLSMNVIAEGIENEEQAKFLIENKCYIAQGFYYAKPMNKSDYFKLLKKEEL